MQQTASAECNIDQDCETTLTSILAMEHKQKSLNDLRTLKDNGHLNRIPR